MKKILCIILCFQLGIIFSQEENHDQIINEANQFIATGNEVLTRDGNFPKAEGEYRKAIAKNPVNSTAKYNLANAYYNSEKYDEATQRYTEAAKVASSRSEKHKAFHNQGNTYMEQKKYKEAVEAYKNALRNNPKDDKTRYNLALAKKMLEQQQQQNDQNQDKDQNKDQNQDDQDKKEGEDKEDKKGDNDDQDKKEGEDQKDKEGDKENEDKGEDKKDEGDKEKDDKGKPEDEKKDQGEDQKDQQGNPKDQQQQQQQVQGRLSPEQVKSLLEAMNNQEKKVQDKINAKKAQGSKAKTDKDW